MNSSEKILITGGAGSVGVYLARRLAEQGKEVVIADNFFRGKRDPDLEALLAMPNVTLIEADLTTREGWDSLGTGYTHVYQLASINGTKLFYEMPHEVLRIGVTTTLHSLEWLKDTHPNAKILYTSSNEAYAGALDSFNQLPIPTPEKVPHVISDVHNPRWTYAGTKLIGEMFYIHFAKAHGLKSVIVRPHNFYGPRTGYDHVIPEFIERIEQRVDPFPIYGADNTRTFCYMEDAVEAMQMVMESDTEDGAIYHIGRPHSDEVSMQELAEKLFDIAGWKPTQLDIQNSPEGSVKRRAADVSKIEQEIGWKAKVPFEEGLKRTLEWYRKNPKKK